MPRRYAGEDEVGGEDALTRPGELVAVQVARDAGCAVEEVARLRDLPVEDAVPLLTAVADLPQDERAASARR